MFVYACVSVSVCACVRLCVCACWFLFSETGIIGGLLFLILGCTAWGRYQGWFDDDTSVAPEEGSPT